MIVSSIIQYTDYGIGMPILMYKQRAPGLSQQNNGVMYKTLADLLQENENGY